MVNQTCWYCQCVNDQIADDFIGDFLCKFCNVLNSCYNSADNKTEQQPNNTTESEWLNEEGEMPFEKPQANWLKLPKVGESYDYSQHGEIVEIKKIEGQKGFNFRQKVTEKLFDAQGNEKEVVNEIDLGYRYEVIFTDGKRMSISDWASYYALTKADVKEGDSIKIDHPEKGKWLLEKV